MRWFLRALVVASLAAGCDEGDTGNFETGTATSPSKPKSNGFSADLAKTMGSDGKSNDKADAKPDTKSDAKPDTKPDAKADAKPDTKPDTKADATPDPKADAKPDTKADTKADAKPDTKADAKPDTKADTKPDTKADAKPDTKADAKPDKADAKPDTKADAKPETKVAVASPGAVKPPINLTAPRVAVKPSAELAAIKLSLSPNWDRDIGEAGTISLVVKVPGKADETRVFAFRYGYEDAKAPTDRDAYKKWLAENKIFTVKMDRQRGSAWYLEGEDATGPAFRILVNYGGKKLICGGSLYRDAQSSQLGDIRDKTIIQAKEICETLQL